MGDFLSLISGLIIIYFLGIFFRKLFRSLKRAADRMEAAKKLPPLTEEEKDMPYNFSKYFFSKSELEFYRILNCHLDAQRYTLFPKVRLADFVEVDKRIYKDWPWLNKITSKHVDYLIWDLVESRIVLAIELDGKSHNGFKMSKSDNFKDQMYKKIGLSLERVRVGSNFEDESRKIVKML